MTEAEKKEHRSHAKGVPSFLPGSLGLAIERERRNAAYSDIVAFLQRNADYRETELRIMADIDPGLVDGLKAGFDIHRKTAAAMFKCAEADVTPDQRKAGKLANFHLLYGPKP